MDGAEIDRHCLNCQSYVRPKKKFCGKCGSEVYSCPHCSAVVDKEDSFCSDCGKTLDADLQGSCSKAEARKDHEISNLGNTLLVELASGEDVASGQALTTSESQEKHSDKKNIIQSCQGNKETASEAKQYTLETTEKQEHQEHNRESSAVNKNVQNRNEVQNAQVTNISTEFSSNEKLENSLKPEISQAADGAAIQEENQRKKTPKHLSKSDSRNDLSSADIIDAYRPDRDLNVTEPIRPETNSPNNETEICTDIYDVDEELVEIIPTSNRIAEEHVEDKLDKHGLLRITDNCSSDLSDKSPLSSRPDEKGDLIENQMPNLEENPRTILSPKKSETHDCSELTRRENKEMQTGTRFGAAMDCESTHTVQKDTKNAKQDKTMEALNDKESPQASTKIEKGPGVKPQQSQMQQRKQGLNENQMMLSEQYFKVDFRVVISRGFKFDSDKHNVIIRTNQEKLGGWNSDSNVLKCAKILDHHFEVMQMTLELCKGWFLNGNSFEYKYLMKEKDNADKKVKWEHTPKEKNRVLKFAEPRLSKLDSWIQYDGIMHKEPKRYARRALNKIWHPLKEETPEVSPQSEEREAILELLPVLKITEGEPSAYIYENIVHVFSCLDKHWKYSSEVKEHAKDFKQEILLEYIVKYLRRTCSSNIDSNESEKEAEQRLAGGMVIVLICADNDLPCAEITEITVPLFNALCIRPVKPGNESFEYNRLVTYHFPDSKERLTDVLCKLINGLCFHGNRAVRPDIQYLKAFPLLHFLLGASKPGLPVETNTHHRNKKWWGIDRVGKSIGKIKYAIKTDKNKVAEHLTKSQPLFTTDYLLQRSIMAVANWSQLCDVFSTKAVDVGVSLACMSYHITTSNLSEKESEMISIFIHLLVDRNKMEEKSLLSEVDIGKSIMKRQLDIQIYMDFLNTVLTSFKSYRDFIVPVIQLVAYTLLSWELLIARYEVSNKSGTHIALRDELNVIWEELSRIVCNWLKKALPKVPLILRHVGGSYAVYLPPTIAFEEERELQIFSQIMDLDVGERADWWISIFVDLFKTRLKQHTIQENVTIFCSIDPNSYHPRIEECFASIALDAVDSGHTGVRSWDFIFDYMDGTRTALFAQLLTKLMAKQWPKSQKRFDVINMALEWKSFGQYLKIYGQGKTMYFEERCTKYILLGIDYIDETVEEIKRGNIQLDLLSMVSRNFESFDYLCSPIQGQTKLKDIINVRTKEMDACMKCRADMAYFLQMCYEIKIDGSIEAFDNLKKVLELDPNRSKLNEICEVCPLKDLHSEEFVSPPRITLFQLSPKVMKMCAVLNDLKESTLFHQFWMPHGTKALSEKSLLSVPDVVEQVLHPALEGLKSLAERLLQGVVTLKEVDLHFSRFKNKLEDLKREIVLICPESNTECLDKRLLQIEQYYSLDIYKQGANILIEIKDGFDLKGDFSALNILTDVGNDKSQPLRSMTDEVLDAGSAVKMITEKEANCIKAFHEAKSLVTWLQDSVKGTKEIKTLVDLAMISAQYQGAWVVERVLLLDAAATAYAPLIYDIRPEDGFEALLTHCKRVWHMLRTDPKLPQKLLDMNKSQNIQWLKNLHESHGSVEVNAMTQAANINTNGIYMVGNLEDRCQLESDPHKKHTIIASVLDENEDVDKRLGYESLCDLQSKLMLVAGEAEQKVSLHCGEKDIQGTKEIERFVEMLDGVTRLATVYTKLNNAGCMLFKHWNVTFDCSPNKEMHTEIDFGNKTKRTLIKGYKASTHDVGDEIKHVCEFMEACLKDWTQMISIKRQEFYFLNHFTTEQLVILCTETAKVYKQTGKFSQKLGFLLEGVKPNCTKEDLVFAIVASKKELGEAQNDEMEENQSDIKQDQECFEFIEHLKEAGFSQKIAETALAAVGNKDKSKGLLWCFENKESIPEDEDDLTRESDIVFTRNHFNSIREETFEEMTQNLIHDAQSGTSRALKGRLTDIWLKYMKATSNTNLSDAFSIELLGHILQNLFEKGLTQRSLPPSCCKGQANLIICPENQMLQLFLSVYLDGSGRKCSLPNVAEILVCTPDTQAEEVELLFRRAFGEYGKGNLYCLLGADRLSYDAEMNLEKFYNNASKENDFQLLIICAKERVDKSAIVTAFGRFRRENPVLQEPRKLQKCIRAKFLINLNKSNHAPAQVDPDEDGAGHVSARFNSDENESTHALARFDPEWSCVRVIQSRRSGVGKSLKALRLAQQAYPDLEGEELRQEYVRIKLHRQNIEESCVVEELFKGTIQLRSGQPRLIHIDIAHEVENGVDDFLFKLMILGSLAHKDGTVWQRSANDLYIIEAQPIKIIHSEGQNEKEINFAHPVFYYLPTLTCRSPSECRDILRLTNGSLDAPVKYIRVHKNDQLFDDTTFETEEWQRVYQYLKHFQNNSPLEFKPEIKGDHLECLEVLLRHCGLVDPSWAELRHFVWFLNIQLRDCDESVFCGPVLEQDLPDFKLFVVKSMIQMSRDFATRSLTVSEEGYFSYKQKEEEFTDDLAQFQLKRHWESSPHPYVFFNADRVSMSFLGFNIGPNGEMVDLQTGQILEHDMISIALKNALIRNYVPLNEDFDKLNRCEKIDKLHQIMGIQKGMATYPDESYVLTTDNVKKIMAIYMRFRCGIPVIIMGETGCGKTRLIKFLCDLQKPPERQDLKNMVLMKVHGGITAKDIENKLDLAIRFARENRKVASNLDTVLFFDEANTTEDIGKIKQIMVDNDYIIHKHGIKIVAACNPYRKHSFEMVRKLERAGLGYHVQAEKTTDKLGKIPMRRLVYRVQPLPQSMIPLIWDFGQLDRSTELQYIKEMVDKYDECSFVSLRDVERTLRVMFWFFQHRSIIFPAMNKLASANQMLHNHILPSDDESGENNQSNRLPDDVTRALVLAIGVCYHACLDDLRSKFRAHISPFFEAPLCPLTSDIIKDEITRCQDVFLNEVQLDANIAKNQALRENVFMMIVCIELRIPLFIVGKPGSSKSLAKTIVSDAMQGDSSKADLFRHFKSVRMVSYQCSPLSTPQGIVETFKQCADLQKDKDLDKIVSVVVLDEVGLAEDSRRMPLKALHPLLEGECEEDAMSEPYMKVGFIGLSNWALDPAKMNRGILLQRGVPDVLELTESGKGICATDDHVKQRIMPYIEPMAKAYLKLFENALEIREFFGLRDFYGIIKMVYGFSKRSGKPPTWFELKHCIMRNFGGLDNAEPLAVFEKELVVLFNSQDIKAGDQECSKTELIKACLFGDDFEEMESESRYLLILTENYAALTILRQELSRLKNAHYIFGSSFPKDQEYTQVCRNINKIKICMETGQTVVLMNLQSIYESLYDALNQYYVYLGGQRFVDLGLGTNRLKCKVHKNFRLIVVAEKQVVYETFPIPLINRLEKHTLTMETILSEKQRRLVDNLTSWAESFLSDNAEQLRPYSKNNRLQFGDVFIGYKKDTAASIIMQVSRLMSGSLDESHTEFMDKCKRILLQCATPESIERLSKSRLHADEKEIHEIYWNEQKHSDIQEFLKHFVVKKESKYKFFQITTHSKLLSVAEVRDIRQALGLCHTTIQLESLQAFDTEQQFCRQIKSFFGHRQRSLLLLQCNSGKENTTLNASARYNILEAYRNEKNGNQKKVTLHKHVIMIVQLPRESGGCFTGYEGGQWLSYHIDELLPDKNRIRNMHTLRGQSVSSLLQSTPHESKTGLPEVDTFLDTYVVYHDSEQIQVTEEPLIEDTVEEMNISKDSDQEPTAYNENLVRKSLKENWNQGVDVEELVRSSAHDAASMLEDDMRNLDRKTERVRLLTELLKKGSSEVGITLIAAFRSRLHSLQAEKEKELSGSIAQDWLQIEAASQDSIIRAGTYSRSVWQSLQMKIKPCLAGIISLSDSNNNLDLLHGAQEGSWIQKMWLILLKSPVATRLGYNDLTTVLQSKEVNKIRVLNHGYQGAFFVNKCPFSWVIKQKLDLIICQAHGNHEDENPKQTVTRLFNECVEGKIIKICASGPEYEAYCKSYRHDFIKMNHQFQSSDFEAEFSILEDAILRLYNYQSSESTYTVLLPETDLHMLYQSIKSRLDLFDDAVQIFPDIASTIAKTNNGPNVFTSSNDFSLDVQALQILVQDLNVSEEITMSEENRNAWQQKVEKYTPVVEKAFNMINHPRTDTYSYSDICLSAAKTCRSNWNAICAVQLYILHVCKASLPQEHGFTADICHMLSMLFQDNVDFKEKNAFEKLEQFLTIGNNKAFKHYFGDLIKCPHCAENAEKLVRIPCKEQHEVCSCCLDKRRQMDLRECPVCRDKYESELQVEPIERFPMETVKAYSNYKERCNSFFMEVVTRLCFAGDKPPSDGMVHKLLSYVTKPGKNHENEEILLSRPLLVQCDTIDPTPTVRSLLLQLLLRSNLKDVESHLMSFFEQGQIILGGDEEHSEQLCLLFVHCIEDSLFGQYAQFASLSGGLRFAIRQIRLGSNLKTEHNIVAKLENIAQTRFALTITAGMLHKFYCTNEQINCYQDYKELEESASTLCDSTHIHWVRLFLIRTINRRFGFEVLTLLTQKESLKWILPEQIRKRSEEDKISSDRYIVYGDQYIAMKTSCRLALKTEDFSKIIDTFAEIDKSKRELIFHLALEREIRLFNLEHKLDVLPVSLRTNLAALLKDEDFITQRRTLSTIVEKQANYVDAATCSGVDSMIWELLIHLDVVLNITPIGQAFEPLRLLAVAPAKMAGAYLPTMPQDFFSEFQKFAEHMRGVNENENMTLYSCPNGHMYAIGDCGRPYFLYTCKECGAHIGGKSHTAAEGNIKVERDNTATGYILGAAKTRPDVGIPERDLTPACTALLRILTHLSMILGAGRLRDDVIRLIDFPIEEERVLEFLMDHIKKDLKVLSTLLNNSPEDCVLSIHIFLANVVQAEPDFGVTPTMLKTQQERALWESQVACLLENKCLNISRDFIDQINERMIQDCTQDSYAIVRILYPKPENGESLILENLDQSFVMWELRAQITADNFAQLLAENMTRKDRECCQLLNQFLSKEHLLRALRFLPDIIKLQKMLIRRYSNRIDSREAHKLKIQEFFYNLQEGQQHEYKKLLQSFGKAWTMLKDEIATFTRRGQTVPIEYRQIDCNNIENQPLALLLPSWRGAGLCALALVYVMVGIQNDFLEFYGSLTGKSVAKGLPVGECNVVNLISYHPEQTLLPMLLASRNYTLYRGSASQNCTYDFYALQRQIEDRLIKGRTRTETEINGESVVETIVFRDSTNAQVFRLLKNRIPQRKLDPTLTQQISSEYRHITEINQSLALVNVTIGYLVSVDRDPQMTFQHFITDHLALNEELHSQHARRGVRLCHVRSLWLLLSHLKAMELNNLGHDAFDNVDSVYKEKLTAERVTDLHRALQQSTVKAFMDALYECIVLFIAVKSDDDDDDQIRKLDYPLGRSLHEYMESQGCKPLALLTHGQFPEHLCFRHAIASWKEAYSFLPSGK